MTLCNIHMCKLAVKLYSLIQTHTPTAYEMNVLQRFAFSLIHWTTYFIKNILLLKTKVQRCVFPEHDECVLQKFENVNILVVWIRYVNTCVIYVKYQTEFEYFEYIFLIIQSLSINYYHLQFHKLRCINYFKINWQNSSCIINTY